MNEMGSFSIRAVSAASIIVGFVMSTSIKSTVYPDTGGG